MDTVHVVLFFAVLIIAAYSDVKYHILPNWLTIPATFCGFILGFAHSGPHGLFFSVIGWTIGFFPFYLLYHLKGIGAGDVKLMGAVGALGGPNLIILSFWYTSIIGFLMAVFLLLKKKKILWGFEQTKLLLLKFAGKNQDFSSGETDEKLTIPYGLAIVFGSYIAFFNTAI